MWILVMNRSVKTISVQQGHIRMIQLDLEEKLEQQQRLAALIDDRFLIESF